MFALLKYLFTFVFVLSKKINFNYQQTFIMAKIIFPDRDQLREIHLEIKQEYEGLLKLSDGKNKIKTLDYLAEKYGYSSGQAVRNMLNNLKKKTKKTRHGIN